MNAKLLAFAAVLVLPVLPAVGETALLDTNTPWRAFLVLGPKVMVEGDALRIFDVRTRDVWKGVAFDPSGTKIAHFLPLFSRLPDARWTEAGYDDAHWARYLPADLEDYTGDYGAGWAGGPHGGTWPALLCLRSRFGVSDPAAAQDVKVTVSCLGGAVVYVNGKETGRGFVPDGTIHPLTPATDLPIEAYTLPDGVTPMPFHQINATSENRARADRRNRTFTLDVPPSARTHLPDTRHFSAKPKRRRKDSTSSGVSRRTARSSLRGWLGLLLDS